MSYQSIKKRDAIAASLLGSVTCCDNYAVCTIYQVILDMLSGDMIRFAKIFNEVFGLTDEISETFHVISSMYAFLDFIIEVRDHSITQVDIIDRRSVAKNVLFIDDYQHLRKSAA